jgi:hypothetical protein
MTDLKIATIDDLDILLKLSEEFYYSTPYEVLEFDLQKTAKSLTKLLESSNEENIVLLLNDEEGFLIGSTCEPLFTNNKVAVELAFYVKNTNGMKWYTLFEAFQYWAKKVGCVAVQSGSIKDRYGKFLKRRGFNPMEEIYQKGLV